MKKILDGIICRGISFNKKQVQDPIEFFTDFNIKTTTRYFPDRGDIVPLSGRTMLVLSKRRTISETVQLLLYL